ncbi:MAG: sugar phosphate isomerase/epimerase family protein [Lacunisphaera sp.]
MNPSAPLPDLSRLCVHTITTKPWAIETAAAKFSKAGVKGITVWRDTLAGRDIAKTGQLLRDSGLSIVSLCRGGFFPAVTATDRAKALDDNRQAIAEAHALGAPLIVLVCGAVPGQSLVESRQQITDGIAALLPDCQAAGVKLAIEPLHPMYADARSAVNTLGQANDMVEALQSPCVGVAADVYHLWWDPMLEAESRPLWPAQRPLRLPRLRLAHADDRPAQRPWPHRRRLHSPPPDPRLGRSHRLRGLQRSRSVQHAPLGTRPGRVPRKIIQAYRDHV